MNTIKHWIGAAAFAVALVFSFSAAAAPKFPALSGRVVDEAHILSAGTTAELTQKLEALEQNTGRQLVVVTLASLQGYDIADYGYQLGRAWGIGQKGKNDGVLFIVAPNEREVRIEVGYGLEPVLTDALSSVILAQKVTPRFRAGDMEGGIVGGTDALIEQLSLDEATAKTRVQQAKQSQERQGRGINPIFVLVMIFVILSIFGRMAGGRRSGLWWLPLLFMGGGGGRGGWGGGGFGGGGFGGGGFGGGGGSFGGGGASGRW